MARSTTVPGLRGHGARKQLEGMSTSGWRARPGVHLSPFPALHAGLEPPRGGTAEIAHRVAGGREQRTERAGMAGWLSNGCQICPGGAWRLVFSQRNCWLLGRLEEGARAAVDEKEKARVERAIRRETRRRREEAAWRQARALPSPLSVVFRLPGSL